MFYFLKWKFDKIAKKKFEMLTNWLPLADRKLLVVQGPAWAEVEVLVDWRQSIERKLFQSDSRVVSVPDPTPKIWVWIPTKSGFFFQRTFIERLLETRMKAQKWTLAFLTAKNIFLPTTFTAKFWCTIWSTTPYLTSVWSAQLYHFALT